MSVCDVPPGCPLSPNQYGVLRMLALGMTYKQIALATGRSASTIRTHLHNAYQILGVADRAQAVLLAAREGWMGEPVVFGEVTLPAITRLAPYDPVPDRLRGFAREYVESLDTHLIDPDDAQANRSLAVAAEGLGLGRHERNRATRNDFIDAVLDGLAGRSYHRSTRMLRSDKCWILVESSHSELAMSQKVRVVRAGLDASRAAI